MTYSLSKDRAEQLTSRSALVEKTLRHGAVQLFFCTKIKTEIEDSTIGMSPLSITAPNAGFNNLLLGCPTAHVVAMQRAYSF